MWKRIEKFFIVVGFLAAVTAIIGFYFQIQTKRGKVQFEILSKDYLTTANNIAGLKSNYEYGGIPVKNLWLVKFKIINNGQMTLYGKGDNMSLLDTSIKFIFDPCIQVIDQLVQIQSNFPDHKLLKTDNNTISLSFQQWREGEYLIYSAYIKSDVRSVQLIPKVQRVIKDGNIKIVDLSNKKIKPRQAILDSIFMPYFANSLRVLSILIVLGYLVFISWGIIHQEFYGWFKFLRWKAKYYNIYAHYISSDEFLNDLGEGITDLERYELLRKKDEFISSPVRNELPNKFWAYAPVPRPTSTATIRSWKGFIAFAIALITSYLFVMGVILGLWVK